MMKRRGSKRTNRSVFVAKKIVFVLIILSFVPYVQFQLAAVRPTSSLDTPTAPTKPKSSYCFGPNQIMKSVDDIRRCYPKEMVRKLPSPSCDTIEDWEDVQKCLTGRFVKNILSDSSIHIIGERNSGTKFIMHEVQKCFLSKNSKKGVAGTHIGKIHRDFLRSKHFFQPVVRGAHTHSFVIAIFRDPVEWVAAMREQPYHSPNHIAGFSDTEFSPLPWEFFVSKPWSMERSDFDKELLSDQNKFNQFFKSGNKCHHRFMFSEVTPCLNSSIAIPNDHLRGYYPVYELRRDGSGKPFENIVSLRSDKIVNFLLQVPMLLDLGGYMAVRYEDLLANGTRPFLEHVSRMIGLEGHLPDHCQPTEPQPDRIGRRHIPIKMRQWVDQHVDGKIERLLGYR